MLDPGSLTRRLQQVCSRFRVQVYRQGWARPMLDEAHALGLRAGERAWVREVHLFCDEQPCVFARTIIPRTTLQGKYRRLTRLGNRSLGAVLFADKTLRRSDLDIAVIGERQALFTPATVLSSVKPAKIWGRRSLFHLSNRPLLLSEIFLHDMSGYLSC
ncbi:MAG TPA: chorismate lyase, partial [Gammaproteobacteria bacterium]|nr:chorismate lyase [Gammaproteobacteria bacterium]